MKEKIEICGYCRRGFIPTENNPFYCSEECRRLNERKFLNIIKCAFCGKDFLASGHNIYCNEECKRLHNLQKRGRRCRCCGKVFIPDARKYFYCSDRCKNSNREKADFRGRHKHYWLKTQIDKIDSRINYLENKLSNKTILMGEDFEKISKKEIARLNKKREIIIKRFSNHRETDQ